MSENNHKIIGQTNSMEIFNNESTLKLYKNIAKDRLNGLKWRELIEKYQTNKHCIRQALIACKKENPGVNLLNQRVKT